ncbi:MAG: hypothetical protein WBQ18_05555 [Solirubrobacteraceae bacterium]
MSLTASRDGGFGMTYDGGMANGHAAGYFCPVQHQRNPSLRSENPDYVRHGDFARHRATIVAAETRRLERELLALGPMHRDRLAERCGTHRWREGTFEEAVHQGIQTGQLRRLPFDWIAAGTSRGDVPPYTSA